MVTLQRWTVFLGRMSELWNRPMKDINGRGFNYSLSLSLLLSLSLALSLMHTGTSEPHLNTHSHKDTHTHTHTYACTHVHAHTHTHTLRTHTYITTHISICSLCSLKRRALRDMVEFTGSTPGSKGQAYVLMNIHHQVMNMAALSKCGSYSYSIPSDGEI